MQLIIHAVLRGLNSVDRVSVVHRDKICSLRNLRRVGSTQLATLASSVASSTLPQCRLHGNRDGRIGHSTRRAQTQMMDAQQMKQPL